jgi:hypothetical protein
MAIINSYPLATPETTDLVLGTKKGSNGRNLTKSFTVASLQAITAGVTSITSSTPTTIVIGGTSEVPTIGATTGSVTQNGTPLATGGQIYDFVINNHPGTVTSVGFDVTAISAFSITGSPITSSGTLTLGISGGSAGQYLDYTGAWSTPPGSIDGTGTTNKVSKWQDSDTLTDSNITDTGTLITLGSASKVTGTLELDNDLIDVNGNTGTAGQLLKSLGGGNAGVEWTAAPVTGVSDFNTTNANLLTITGTGTGPYTGNVVATPNVSGGVSLASNTLATGADIQAAINTAVAGGVTFKGGFNANTGVIDGGTDNLTTGGTRVAISVGDLYVVTTAGNFYGDATIPLAVGDQVLCQTAATQGSSTSANWVTIESNVVAATAGATDTATVKGVAGFDNQMFSATSNGYITSTTVNQIPITVANVGGSNYYFVDGTQQADITLMPDVTYFIDQSASNNDNHPLILSTTSPSQTEYATGVVYLLDNAVVANAAAYNTGFNAATTRQIRVTLTQTAPTLYYVCYNHQGMGGDIGRGGSGSVTSVGLALTSLAALQVSNSPITSSGNIGLTVTGGSAGQYLDYQGNWSTPASGASTRVVNRSTISNATTGTHDCGTVNQTDVNYIDVYVSGVYQNKNTYTAAYDSGTGKTTITLTGGAYYPNGAVVESVTI